MTSVRKVNIKGKYSTVVLWDGHISDNLYGLYDNCSSLGSQGRRLG